MAKNKIVFGDQVLIDLNDSTVTPETLAEGIIAYDKHGDKIIGTMKQGGDMSDLFYMNLGDEYVVVTEEEAPAIIAAALNIDGFEVPVGTSGIIWKKPTVIVPPIPWSTDVDENYNLTGQADVEVRFGTAGSLKKTVIFKKPGPGKLYAVKLSDPTAMIETGIAAKYEYKYIMRGHTQQGNQSALIDAFISTTARATVRILGGSNKAQSMWPANKEATAAQTGIDFNKMFEMTAAANYLQIIQGATTATPSITGQTTSGDVGTTITLMGSRSGNIGMGVLALAEIRDENDAIIGQYMPFKITGDEVVLVDTHGLTAQQIYDIVQNGDAAAMAARIHRPDIGELVEVTKAEDEA